MTVNAIDGEGRRLRISLPKPIWKGREEIGVGITRCAIYVGSRTGRVVEETYSIWENRHGYCTGTQYEIIEDHNKLAQLAAVNNDVANAMEQAKVLVPEDL